MTISGVRDSTPGPKLSKLKSLIMSILNEGSDKNSAKLRFMVWSLESYIDSRLKPLDFMGTSLSLKNMRSLPAYGSGSGREE